MTAFDALTPFGLLTFGREPSLAAGPYQQLKNAYAGGTQGSKLYDMTPGASYKEALVYATAIAIGSARALVQTVANNERGLHAFDKLPVLEEDYGVIPGALDTVTTRQANVHARELIMAGSREESIKTELQALLGTGLLKYRTTKASEVLTWPSSPGNVGTWLNPALAPKYYTLLDSVDAILGTSTVRSVRFSPLNGTPAPIAGEKYCIEPSCNVTVEAITVTSVAQPAGTPAGGASTTGPWTVTATFKAPHSVGAAAVNNAPMWISTQREVQVVVTSAVARNTDLQRRIGLIMQRHMKTTTRWRILEGTSATQVGPFVVGVGFESFIGASALGASAFTF